MKEIWFINQYAISPDLPGGTRHYDFGLELVRKGYRVRIFAASVNLALQRTARNLGNRLWMEEEINQVLFEWVKTGVHLRNDWRRALNMLKFSWNIYQVGRKLGVKPDVIVGSSPHLFAARAGLFLAGKFNCKFVFEIRDLWPKALIDMGAVNKKHPMVVMMNMLEKQLICKSDHIVVLSKGPVSYLKQKRIPENKISYIPNGVHPGIFKPCGEREEMRRHYGFKDFTVVYTGAHGPANSLETILHAAAELNNEKQVKFVLVGGGSEKSNLQARAGEMGLKNVSFTGPLAREEIPGLLLAADAAVITLKDAEAFYEAVSPNKFYDYLAAGKPVLCAAPGEVSRLTADYGCGLISPPEDGKTLARQVRVLSGLTPAQREQMGNNGRQLVWEQFSREKLVEKYIDIF